MPWIRLHHLLLGLLADGLTFLGAVFLARDAFLRLRDLQRKRTDEEFRKRFPALNLNDQEWHDAVASLGWSIAGFALIAAGFACQIVLRFTE